MPSVLLIRPLCEGDEPEFAEPLGIERLAGYLRAYGVGDVRVYDRRLYQAEWRSGIADEFTGGLFDDLRKAYPPGRAPALVGLSLMTSADVPDARRIMSRLGRWWPQATFMAGGVYVTGAPEEAARVLPRGVILQRGEGEAQLLALARATGATGAEAPPFVSPDDWAIPHRPYPERYAALGCAVNVQASRGCPGACTFCATPLLPKQLRRWQPRDLRLVVDEMQQVAERLAAAGLPPIFNFVDDDFGPLFRLEGLADELGRRRLRVAFACEMRLVSLIGQPALAERLARLARWGSRGCSLAWSRSTRRRSSAGKALRRLGPPAGPEAFERLASPCSPDTSCGMPGRRCGGAGRGRGLRRLGIYSHRAALSRLIVFPGCALAHGSIDATGFQSMDAQAEAFCRRFSAKTGDLTRMWTQAAIAEPHAVAEAFLTGDGTRLATLRDALDEANERSFTLFMEMSA